MKNANQARELRKKGIEVVDDYQDLLKNRHEHIDIITLPSSIISHSDMTISTLKNGYSVLLEKPPAPTIDELDSMRQVENQSAGFCSVGFQFIHSKSIRKLKKL